MVHVKFKFCYYLYRELVDGGDKNGFKSKVFREYRARGVDGIVARRLIKHISAKDYYSLPESTHNHW